jgi:hypothetical protein
MVPSVELLDRILGVLKIHSWVLGLVLVIETCPLYSIL